MSNPLFPVIDPDESRRETIRHVEFDILPDNYRDALQLGIETNGDITPEEIEEMNRLLGKCRQVFKRDVRERLLEEFDAYRAADEQPTIRIDDEDLRRFIVWRHQHDPHRPRRWVEEEKQLLVQLVPTRHEGDMNAD